MLLSGKAHRQPVDALPVSAARNHAVDAILVALVDRVERLAAMIEVQLVGARVGQRRREIVLEG